MSRVSICIPVYNREKILPKAIKACLAQTYKDIEIVVCDNASTDSTKEIVLAYAQKDARVKFYENDENIGALRNFKRTIELAESEFVVLLGSDDWISENFVEERIRGFELCPDAAFISGPMAVNTLYDDGSYELVSTYQYQEKELSQSYVYNNFYRRFIISYFCLFRKTDILNNFAMTYYNPYGWEIYDKGYGLDLINCLNIMKNYTKAYYVQGGVYNFVNHGQRESEDILPEDMKEENHLIRTLDDYLFNNFLFFSFLTKNNLNQEAKQFKDLRFLQLCYEIFKNRKLVFSGDSFSKKFKQYCNILNISKLDIIKGVLKLPFYILIRIITFAYRKRFKKELF